MSENKVKKQEADVREYTDYVVRNIKKIVKKCGSRAVGGEGDKKAVKYFLEDTENVCDEASVESFKCSDKAFMSWVPVGAVLLMLSFAFYIFGMASLSLVLILLTVFFIVSEFILYKKTLDIFFKKKESSNIIGVRKASGETKRRIILSGHTDSAFEWTYTYHGGRPAVATIIVSAVAAIVVGIAGSVAAIVSGYAFKPSLIFANASTLMTVFAIIMLVLTPIMIAALFFCNYKRPVDGANDDLTGCYISLAAVKYLKDNDIRFENTEIQVALVGGEEAGLRGSSAFVENHKEQLKDDNIETAVVSIDTIHDFDFMEIIDCDLNGTVKNDSRVAALIKEGAHIAGYDNVKTGTISLGATDAAAFSREGVPAASFVAMDPTPARYYHTRLDTADNLDEKTIEATVKIALETVFLFDKKGLNG